MSKRERKEREIKLAEVKITIHTTPYKELFCAVDIHCADQTLLKKATYVALSTQALLEKIEELTAKDLAETPREELREKGKKYAQMLDSMKTISFARMPTEEAMLEE